ncbi:MAG TPA: hypothetical protein VFZ27_02150 [Terriglobia bacterium]|nr:hypothetical protein [Terriglobia bacterium]
MAITPNEQSYLSSEGAAGNLAGIRWVKISFDGGKNRTPTAIFSNPSPIVWTLWKYTWVNPRPGKYGIRVRGIATVNGASRHLSRHPPSPAASPASRF